MIRLSPIRVIGADNEQLGVIETRDAIQMALDQGLDLVEISPDARPPVCKIMDYGKYKYDQSKKDKKGGAKSTEMKQIRLGRSIKIGDHDVEIRVDQARRFILAGHKVQVTQRFRGREIVHKHLGIERLARIAKELEDVAKVETSPRWMGRQASIILAPDKPKVESYKRKLAKAKAESDASKSKAQPTPPGVPSSDSPAADSPAVEVPTNESARVEPPTPAENAGETSQQSQPADVQAH